MRPKELLAFLLGLTFVLANIEAYLSPTAIPKVLLGLLAVACMTSAYFRIPKGQGRASRMHVRGAVVAMTYVPFIVSTGINWGNYLTLSLFAFIGGEFLAWLYSLHR